MCIIISFLYMYLSVRSYYLPSSRSVVVSHPEELRVRQEVRMEVVADPPQIVFFSMLCRYLLSGRSGS